MNVQTFPSIGRLASILEHVEDVKAGIPYIWKILGGILGPMVAIEEGTFPLSELTTFVKPRMNSSDFNLLVMEAVAASGKFSVSFELGYCIAV